jgi:hypothetical protein
MNDRRSVCGPLAIGLPLLGLGVEAAAVLFLHPSSQNASVAIVLLGALGTFLLGIGFSIAGMVRGERLRWLPAIGFGFNLILIAAHFAG